MTLRAVPLLPQPACVSPDTSLMDALHLMLENGVNHLPVCNGGAWAGLVDINDILGELLPVSARGEHALQDLRFVGDGISLIATYSKELPTKQVREVELLNLPTLDEDTPLLEAALLLHRHAKPLPVLDADRKLKGMLSRRILLAHLISKAGS
ncbi:MAG: CBS domain-containing protein [Thiobacillus sp.]|uniref:CBS domain-containing protein n=1 Tax=Thiobacillus sp. TaxID=924 RepID=UPI0028938EDF|nr:CBS domain-containing protein [Thiobacillus sp.]MDT3708090.1 CBS domain-containing protein [Thiobacillus sp.]